MVGEGEKFSETEGPENLKRRNQLGSKQIFLICLTGAFHPGKNPGQRHAQKRGCRFQQLRPIRPAPDSGWIGHTIRIQKLGRCRFPAAMLHKAPPERLTTSQQTVVRVGERKQWQKGKSLLATGAITALDLNPVVMFIVRLLAAASVTDDRIGTAKRTSPQDHIGAPLVPIAFDLARRDGKWDKYNRSQTGLCSGVDLPRPEPEAEPRLLKKNPTGK